MKAIIYCILAVITLQVNFAYSKTLIISDVDDTIKMTDVLGPKKWIFFNGVFREKAFSGMGELYQQLEQQDTVIHYVSGSPKIIRMRVDEFLEENFFPQQYNLSLRNSLSDDTVVYKLNTIRKIIANENPDKIILIGDDTEHDPEIYATIAENFPGLVETIYIRAIQNRAMPELSIFKTFFSAVEIAAYELLKGRMDKEGLKEVGKSFFYRWGKSGIYLKNRYCPTNGRDELTMLAAQIDDGEVRKTLNKTQKKIIKSCN